ncbi:MAG: SprB repeat-containing protein [Lewinellaceae bacterium]|nr:SprB repeat-containing protein [Lewinellaceae bacterium]
MKLLFLLLSLLSALFSPVMSQTPVVACPDNMQPPFPFCWEACIVCDLDGYSSFNQGFPQWMAPPQFCAGEWNSINWVGFIAGSSNIELQIVASNCIMDFGLQAGIYASTDCSSWVDVSNCDPEPSDGTHLFAQGLVPGQYYYLVIDGYANDFCDFEVFVLQGSAQAPPVVGAPVINGPDSICSGLQASYSADSVFGAGYYIWELNGAVIGQEQSVALPALAPGQYQLCVTPGNLCFGNGQPACKAITVASLPPLVLNEEVCSEDLPFIYQGFSFVSAGIHQFVTYDAQGCEQAVVLNLAVLGPNPITLINTAICQGEVYSLGGQVFDQAGNYQVVLTGQNGCDSILNTTLTIIDAPADTLEVTLCEDGITFWNGLVIDQSGIYCDTVSGGAANGCDSITCLSVTVLPTDTTFLNETICEGQALSVGNTILSVEGQYTLALVGSDGCDSIIILDLMVSPLIELHLDTALCPGQELTVGPYTFWEPIQVALQFNGGAGCDTMVNLNLTYNDTLRLDTAIIEPDGCDFFGGSILVEMSGGSPPYSYLWSVGRTEPFIDLLPSGKYFLIVTDANYCQQGFYFKVPYDYEQCADQPAGRPAPVGGGIKVSPNPFSREIALTLSGIDEERPVRLLLYDAAGRLVQEEQVYGYYHRLEPEGPPGVYWLMAEQAGRRAGVERIVRIAR